MTTPIYIDPIFARENERMIAMSMYSVLPPNTRDTLSRAFWTALLLTGQMALAERAVAEAIADSDPTDEAFFAGVVKAAVFETKSFAADSRTGLSILPIELRRVLCLPTTLRHCFVLHILLRFPLDACSQLLRLDVEKITDAVCEAAQELALTDELSGTVLRKA